MLSLGLPMIVMGDEVRRTQRGNNNAYCQDNAISWLDWKLVDKHADMHRFVRLLIQRRLLRDTSPERQRESLSQLIQGANKAWHGVKRNQPDWSDDSHSLAFSAEIRKQDLLFYWILNAYWESLDFELPLIDKNSREPWRRWIDTTLDPPDDIVEWQSALPVSEKTYRTGPRSVVVMFAGGKDVSCKRQTFSA
jgi:glycogen operon protein